MTGLQRLQLACLIAAVALLGALLAVKSAPAGTPSASPSVVASAVAVVPVNGSDSLGLPRRCIRRVDDLGRGLSEATLLARILQQCFRTTPLAAPTNAAQVVLGCVRAVRMPRPGQPGRVTGCLLD